MFRINKKFSDRVSKNLRKYKRIAADQQRSDVSEADTVSLVKDVLANVLGYDKWQELTSEYQIKGTYCDIAVSIGGKLRLLVEVKSAGTALSDNHLRQVVNYGAHQGLPWVLLTNGIEWRLVHIKTSPKIEHETIMRFHLAEINSRKSDDLQLLYLISREGLDGDAMKAFHEHRQVVNAYTLASVITTEPVVNALRREMRRFFPDLVIKKEDISELIETEVLKRDTVESDRAKEAQALVKRASRRVERQKAKAAKKALLAPTIYKRGTGKDQSR